MPLKTVESLTDEELRAELQRRADVISNSTPEVTNDPADLSELPTGAWGQETDDQTKHGSMTSEWEGITRLAIGRIRELLGMPLDPADPNYAASLRGINSAVSSALTLISKVNAEMLRPPKQDRLPELLAVLKEEQEKLWERRLPELVHELIKVSDQELEELLTKRREHLEWRTKHYRAHGFKD